MTITDENNSKEINNQQGNNQPLIVKVQKNQEHMMIRGERLKGKTSVLIENKYENGIYYEEVSIQAKDVTIKLAFSLIDGKTYFSGIHPVINKTETKLGSHITFDNEGLKGWVEYNEQFVAFIDYNQTNNKRRVNRIFDINAKCFLDSKTCDLEEVYKQAFAPEFAFKQPIELPVQKLELKNKCKKLMLD